ncbi:30S ribosomal protein S6 [Candidatus Karelsulcia muelleri]|uniref:30S ribosomal protein S6 n=1 Tax=Candidatus Karelsulcia muelleri TaxID=336810 RepID=UPI000D7CF9E8|nr:30S ribosomal protein S6 [Candidatus Karelsulcia muelleri]
MKYETVLVITPVLSEEQIKLTTSNYINFLIDKKAKLIFQENWGLKKLAYPIQTKTSGCYHIIYFLAKPKLIFNLKLKLLRDEKIMRFLILKINDEALLFFIKKKPQLILENDFYFKKKLYI